VPIGVSLGGKTVKSIFAPASMVWVTVTVVGTLIELVAKLARAVFTGASAGGSTTPALLSAFWVAVGIEPRNVVGAFAITFAGIVPLVFDFDALGNVACIAVLVDEVFSVSAPTVVFFATTVMSYVVPAVKPVMSHEVDDVSQVRELPPAVAVAR
jgi:hypothetical protein